MPNKIPSPAVEPYGDKWPASPSTAADSMVERVACAIALSIGVDPIGFTWRLYEAEARAAIGAMTIPTDAMLNAAESRRSISKGAYIEPRPAEVWQAMIDEAAK